jgi:cell division protein FtsL
LVVAPKKYDYNENYWERYLEEELIQKPVKKVKQKKKVKLLPIMVIILSFLLLNMGLAVKTANISMANIKLDKLNEQLKKLENEKSVLELEVARLKSIDRIEMAAKNSMQMIYASEAPSIRLQQKELAQIKTSQNEEEKITVQSQNNRDVYKAEETWGKMFLSWLNEKINLITQKGIQG